MTTWVDVRPHDVVLGKDGKNWEVERIAPGPTGEEVTLRRLSDDKAYTGSPAGEVTIVSRAAPTIDGIDPLDLATATAQIRLGGEVVARNEGDGRGFIVPLLDRRDLPGIHAHLFLLHGIYTEDIKGRGATAKLVEGHDAEHGPDAVHSGAYVIHTHDPEWK